MQVRSPDLLRKQTGDYLGPATCAQLVSGVPLFHRCAMVVVFLFWHRAERLRWKTRDPREELPRPAGACCPSNVTCFGSTWQRITAFNSSKNGISTGPKVFETDSVNHVVECRGRQTNIAPILLQSRAVRKITAAQFCLLIVQCRWN